MCFGHNCPACMQTLSAKEAKYAFGRLIDLASTGPVAVAKHGQLKALESISPGEKTRVKGETDSE